MVPKPKRVKYKQNIIDVKSQGCCICGKPGDAHHLKTRGAGGTDAMWNLICLCREHHQEVHRLGNFKMSEKYMAFFAYLFNSDWGFDERNKLVRKKIPPVS